MKRLALFALLLFVLPSAKAEGLKEFVGIPEPEQLFDGDLEQAQRLEENAQLRLADAEGMGSVYLILDREYGDVLLTDDTGTECTVPTQGILHKEIDLQSLFGHCPKELTISFPAGRAYLNEVCTFAPGEEPDWVQKWEWLPIGGADLMLFSTHGDDEQLFFAGLLPWYGAEKGYAVQVVYLTDHRNLTSVRVHEMLNGLWNVGIRNYPVFGSFDDYYTFDMEEAYRYYDSAGVSEEKMLSFVVEQLRRFRPQVAVGHDLHGEYGHGMHKLYSDLLCKALEVSADGLKFPESTERYGTWDVPKTYLHLYEENPIVMDWDIPMDSFGGKTAFEVTRDLGFPSHVTQQQDFAWYFRGARKATDVEKYTPCRYGLYRTTVGEDTGKRDFFENIPQDDAPPLPPTEPEPVDYLPELTYLPPDIPKQPTNPMWIVIPAIGTLVLTVMTVFLSAPAGKEKFENM